MEAKKFILLYILGAGHCGSTLLNLLLNGHPDILGLSEIETIGRYLPPKQQAKAHPLRSTFWQKVRRRYNAISNERFVQLDIFHPNWQTIRTWDGKDLGIWAEKNANLLTAIAEQSEADMLVDASKFWQRLYLLRRSERFSLKVIHLVRDGRAVVNAYRRKTGCFNVGFRRWASTLLWAVYLRRQFDSSTWLRIKYESLATRPVHTLQAVCDFLDVNFEPDMLKYRQHAYFGIGGNRMCQRPDERIVLDERWKDELTLSHRLKFALLGGWLNKYYGYGIWFQNQSSIW